MLTPGAKRSTQVPVLAQLGLVSCWSVALTVSAAGDAAGEKLQAFWAIEAVADAVAGRDRVGHAGSRSSCVTASSSGVSRPADAAEAHVGDGRLDRRGRRSPSRCRR